MSSEYRIYLILVLFDYAINTVFRYCQNRSILFYLIFNPPTTCMDVIFCWVLSFQLRLVHFEATFSINFTCWVLALGIGLGIPAALWFISGVVFFMGAKSYVKVKSSGSLITSIVQVFVVIGSSHIYDHLLVIL